MGSVAASRTQPLTTIPSQPATQRKGQSIAALQLQHCNIRSGCPPVQTPAPFVELHLQHAWPLLLLLLCYKKHGTWHVGCMVKHGVQRPPCFLATEARMSPTTAACMDAPASMTSTRPAPSSFTAACTCGKGGRQFFGFSLWHGRLVVSPGVFTELPARQLPWQLVSTWAKASTAKPPDRCCFCNPLPTYQVVAVQALDGGHLAPEAAPPAKMPARTTNINAVPGVVCCSSHEKRSSR